MKLDTPSSRAALKAQRNPHWLKVRVNRFIGFRKMNAARPGTWMAKARINGQQKTELFGNLEGCIGDPYERALELANKWFDQMDRTVVTDVKAADYTIHHALRDYLLAITEQRLKNKAADPQDKHDQAKRRFDLLVMPFVLQRDRAKVPAGQEVPEELRWTHIPLVDLQPADFTEWRMWLRNLPTDPKRSGRSKHGKERSVASVNRDLASFRAALNLAARTHRLPRTWTDALKRDGSEPVAKSIASWKIIPVADRKKLVAKARELEPAFVPFLVAHCIVPVRCGAFSHMTVSNFDQEHNLLTVGRDKANGGREVHIPAANGKDFAAACKGKPPAAPLFTDAGGKPWKAASWRRAFNRCRDAAGLDKRLTVYCLRHSRITDLVDAGRPALEIAKLAGTSVAMIEKHYFQMTADRQREALSVPGL
ncbi:hypothetical protein GCM10028796_21540 [Ramlibacter monticola]